MSPTSAITPTALREFAAVVENLGPNVLRRCLLEAADEIDLLRNRDAAAQTLIGVLRLKAQQAGDPAGGPDFSLYRQYSDLFPPIPEELGGPPHSGSSSERDPSPDGRCSCGGALTPDGVCPDRCARDTWETGR